MHTHGDDDGLMQFAWQGFRHLQTGSIALSTAVNVIYGRNAAGKTSLLEAMHFLARSRSFVTHRSQQLIQHGETEAIVSGQVATQGRQFQLGVQHQRGETRVRLDGRDVQALSESAWLLPVQVINTETQRLLTDGPEVRRAFLNWGVFHVEPTYRDEWRRFQKALRQRNVALRHQDERLAAAWEPEMITAGQRVHQRRIQFLEAVLPAALGIARQWLPDVVLNWRYRPGWPRGAAFESVLSDNRHKELAQGFGLYGPHRADVRLLANKEDAASQLSRGQQKLLVAALRIALVEYWASQAEQRPLLLVDDLPAELDAEHRQQLLERLQAAPVQLCVTTIEPNQLPTLNNGRWFHVEHGQVTPD